MRKVKIMRDEIFDRDYQGGRGALNAWFSQLVEGAARSLRVLNALQFAAPWRHEGKAVQRRTTRHA